MNSRSNQLQLLAIGLLPIIAFCLVAGWNCYLSYVSYQNVQKAINYLDVVGSSSAMIHETNKWHGTSIGYLVGEFSKSRLQDSYAEVEKRIGPLKEKIPQTHLNEEANIKLANLLQGLTSLQERLVAKEIKLSDFDSKVNELQKTLSLIEIESLTETKVFEASEKFRSLSYLAAAKKSVSQLRASLVFVFSRKQPFNDAVYELIVSLVGSINANLKTDKLKLSENDKFLVKDFFSSNEWKSVVLAVKDALNNSQTGSYRTDLGELDVALNKLLNHMQKIIRSESSSTQNTLVALKFKKFKEMSVYFIVMFFFVGVSILVFIIMIARINKERDALIFQNASVAQFRSDGDQHLTERPVGQVEVPSWDDPDFSDL